MNLEKHSGDQDAPQPKTPAEPAKKGKQQPVFLYIIILFSVAFCLILMSFFMHQRSNQEVLGELHSNVNALEQLQDALDENLRLEKELSSLKEETAETQDEMQSEIKDLDAEAKASADALSGMNSLYQLQLAYVAQDYETCTELIAAMEKSGTDKLIPDSPMLENYVPPNIRYQQLKAAVESKLAEKAE